MSLCGLHSGISRPSLEVSGSAVDASRGSIVDGSVVDASGGTTCVYYLLLLVGAVPATQTLDSGAVAASQSSVSNLRIGQQTMGDNAKNSMPSFSLNCNTPSTINPLQHWYECIHTIVSIYAWEYERMYNRYTTVIMSDNIGTTHLTQVWVRRLILYQDPTHSHASVGF